MQRSLTKGPITGSILLFALPLMLAYLLSATPLGVIGIWLSVPIGWALADAIGIGYYLKKNGRGKRRWSTISGSAARGCTT